MVTTSACCRLLTDAADVGVTGLKKLEKVSAKYKEILKPQEGGN
jgi:hypothetical protein